MTGRSLKPTYAAASQKLRKQDEATHTGDPTERSVLLRYGNSHWSKCDHSAADAELGAVADQREEGGIMQSRNLMI